LILIALLVSIGFTREENPTRVISLAPHVTEIIFKIRADSFLIGRTDFCLYPEAAQSIESVGGYLNIDFEKIVSLKPDLIIQFPNDENKRKLESLGFVVIDAPNETIDEIKTSITVIGKLLNKETEASRVLQNIEDTLRLVSDIPEVTTVLISALLVVGRDRGTLSNIYLAGKNTYLSELWEICGGINAFSDVDRRYFPVNEEDLLSRKLHMILEFHPGWDLDSLEIQTEMQAWQLLQPLEAVADNQIFFFNQRFFVVPGPRLTQIAIQFKRLINQYWSEHP
jgi:iron complex transport system substrate-binding protein